MITRSTRFRVAGSTATIASLRDGQPTRYLICTTTETRREGGLWTAKHSKHGEPAGSSMRGQEALTYGTHRAGKDDAPTKIKETEINKAKFSAVRIRYRQLSRY
jgi:hypothetical protein